MRPKANASGNRIRIDAEKSVIRAFIGGLNVEEKAKTIEKATAEALKLLNEHASRHRFRPPYTLRCLTSNGRTIWEEREKSRVYDEGGVTAWAANTSLIDVSYMEGEDGGRQKFSVRVELDAVRKN